MANPAQHHSVVNIHSSRQQILESTNQLVASRVLLAQFQGVGVSQCLAQSCRARSIQWGIRINALVQKSVCLYQWDFAAWERAHNSSHRCGVGMPMLQCRQVHVLAVQHNLSEWFRKGPSLMSEPRKVCAMHSGTLRVHMHCEWLPCRSPCWARCAGLVRATSTTPLTLSTTATGNLAAPSMQRARLAAAAMTQQCLKHWDQYLGICARSDSTGAKVGIWRPTFDCVRCASILLAFRMVNKELQANSESPGQLCSDILVLYVICVVSYATLAVHLHCRALIVHVCFASNQCLEPLD